MNASEVESAMDVLHQRWPRHKWDGEDLAKGYNNVLTTADVVDFVAAIDKTMDQNPPSPAHLKKLMVNEWHMRRDRERGERSRRNRNRDREVGLGEDDLAPEWFKVMCVATSRVARQCKITPVIKRYMDLADRLELSPAILDNGPAGLRRANDSIYGKALKEFEQLYLGDTINGNDVPTPHMPWDGMTKREVDARGREVVLSGKPAKLGGSCARSGAGEARFSRR